VAQKQLGNRGNNIVVGHNMIFPDETLQRKQVCFSKELNRLSIGQTIKKQEGFW
jgi:hypothetical protein